jgi:hypothetical protein
VRLRTGFTSLMMGFQWWTVLNMVIRPNLRASWKVRNFVTRWESASQGGPYSRELSYVKGEERFIVDESHHGLRLYQTTQK